MHSAKDVASDVVEAVLKKMGTLNTYNVHNFRSILKYKTYLRKPPAVAMTPNSHHNHLRGEDYDTAYPTDTSRPGEHQA